MVGGFFLSASSNWNYLFLIDSTQKESCPWRSQEFLFPKRYLRCRKTMDYAQNNSHAYCLITLINFQFKPQREENSNAHYSCDNPHANIHSKVKGCSHVALIHNSSVKCMNSQEIQRKFTSTPEKESTVFFLHVKVCCELTYLLHGAESFLRS